MTHQKIYTIFLSLFISIFLIVYFYVNFGLLRPLKADFKEGQKTLETLYREQENKSEFVDQIEQYRDGLYALNLVLDARKNVISGSDEENPYLVFDYIQVLEDLRRLMPQDARIVRFQVNNKGLLTIPIESESYSSLGRVYRSLKEAEILGQVFVPTAVQRVPRQLNGPDGPSFENIYTFTIQAVLKPEFWQQVMPYPDIRPNDYFAQAVRDLTIAGAIQGYADQTFKPNQPIVLAELFKVALHQFLSSGQMTLDEYEKVIDLAVKDWHEQYIQLAEKMGVIQTEDIRFSPDHTIARIDALRIILTVFEKEIKLKEKTVGSALDRPKVPFPFNDVNEENDFYPIVKTALSYGMLDQEGMLFNPKEKATRAEIAYWVWKLKFEYLN